MNGFLGSYNLIDNLTQSVAQCTTDRYASVTLNLCNRSETETCYVDIAITTVQSVFNATSRYIEFNSMIGPNNSLQRNGILISAGEFLTVVYRGQDPRCLSANTWAVQSGADAGVSPISLVVPVPPVIATTSLPDADQDIEYSQQIVATSTREIVSYSIVAGALPTGLSLNSTTGIISGIPSGVDQTYTFTVRVTDSVDSTQDQEVTITKLPNSTPPVWVTPSSLGSVGVDVPFSLQLEVDEIGVVTYALESGSLPTGLSLSSSGLISGTPTIEETASFVVSATNASSVSANQSFTIEVADILYGFTAATFSTGGQTGRFGPALTTARDGLTGPEVETWKNNTEFFNTTDGIQLWTVPTTGTYRIEAWGAQGGRNFSYGDPAGLGAQMRGDFTLTKGEILRILVGQAGIDVTTTCGGAGGGGGTYVVRAPFNNNDSILVIAGGGGAVGTDPGTRAGIGGTTSTSGTNSNGNNVAGGTSGAGGNQPPGTPCSTAYVSGSGSGFFTNGGGPDGGPGNGDTGGGFSFVNGGNGGRVSTGNGGNADGSFGGGGKGYYGAGAGGGYSGGGGGRGMACNCDTWRGGGGGGSFNSGANQSNVGSTRIGPGEVQITLL